MTAAGLAIGIILALVIVVWLAVMIVLANRAVAMFWRRRPGAATVNAAACLALLGVGFWVLFGVAS